MFTGLIDDIGRLAARDGGRFQIESGYPAQSLIDGASIACDGCCLTLVALEPDGKGSRFAVDVSNETLSLTALDDWQVGRRINLERAMKLGDELGGHIVSGHVDGCAKLIEREEDGDSTRMVFESPPALSRYIAKKGSVALNGVSLTVNEVDGDRFQVNIIPYTLAHTTLSDLAAGDAVNLEVDMLARYVERMLGTARREP